MEERSDGARALYESACTSVVMFVCVHFFMVLIIVIVNIIILELSI